MSTLPSLTHQHLHRAKTLERRAAKNCLRCERLFVPTGQNQKRCAECARVHQLEANRERWHRTYVKKGARDQRGEKNHQWNGGTSPSSYRRICFAAHGYRCFRCGGEGKLVPHLDEDRENNTVENLRPICKRCHQIEHDCTANLPAPGSLKRKPCMDCKKKFKPGSGRALRCSGCRTMHLREVAREKYRRKRCAASVAALAISAFAETYSPSAGANSSSNVEPRAEAASAPAS